MKTFIAGATFLLFLSSFAVVGAQNSLIINPTEPKQGEMVIIQHPTKSLSEVKKILVQGKSLWFFNYQGKAAALYPVDLNGKVGKYSVLVEMENGEKEQADFSVKARERIVEQFTIPESLGGNTAKSQETLVTTLAKETDILKSLRTTGRKYWKENFHYPIADPVITDTYGYGRETGAYTVPHKGTDFKAKTGTAVFSINDGIVRLATETRNYGKIVVIDHGLGLMSLYLHLSKIQVKLGDIVKGGQKIAESGQTGYATGPHLHLSIRINQISIDPEVFFSLFNKPFPKR